jgi:autotransporter-associated beta strand protein
MKTTPIALFRGLRPTFIAALLPFLFLLVTIQSSHGQHGSATWSSDGTENLWGSLADWTPQVIPNGPDDTATFANSTTTYVDFDIFNDGTITLDGIHFVPGADAFTIADYSAAMIFDGAGVVNDSGITQSFITTGADGQSTYSFDGASTAGTLTAYTMQGGSPGNSGYYGIVYFNDQSSAASGTFTLLGGNQTNRFGGEAFCSSTSTLDHATFTINGGGNSAKGGLLSLANSSNAAQSTLIANGGTGGGAGGIISLKDDSLGGTAQIQAFGNGELDISGHNSPGITTGSIAGDGLIFLGANALTIGSNHRNTLFSGVIEDGGASGGAGGSLVKVGHGVFTLNGANTYTGPTTVNGGRLQVANTSGSATGTGAVTVNRGILGGTGTIAGAVNISGTKASLAPGIGNKPGTLTILSPITLGTTAGVQVFLQVELKPTGQPAADQVIASGVTLNPGAFLSFTVTRDGAPPLGTVFTLIDNTSAAPIVGIFSGLPEGSIVSINNHMYMVSYLGGDGNDCTITYVGG